MEVNTNSFCDKRSTRMYPIPCEIFMTIYASTADTSLYIAFISQIKSEAFPNCFIRPARFSIIEFLALIQQAGGKNLGLVISTYADK